MEESLEHIRESAETRMRKNAFMLHNYIELERVEKDRRIQINTDRQHELSQFLTDSPPSH